MSEETKSDDMTPKEGGKKIVKVVNEGIGIKEKVTKKISDDKKHFKQSNESY